MLQSLIEMSKIRDTNGASSPTALTTRSIVLSVLLGSHPPAMPVSALVRFCSLFGISDGTVRTSLSRMVERGELVADDATYRLSGRLLDRQAEQDVGRARRSVRWERDWWIVIVTAERRTVADRRAFRSRTVGAKLGELRPDLWLRPANLMIPSDLTGVLVSRGPLIGADDFEVARALWDLGAIDETSCTLTARLSDSERHLVAVGPAGLASAFVALAQALRHLRTEPQLPDELHSPSAGDGLRSAYQDVERAFRDQLQTFLHEP